MFLKSYLYLSISFSFNQKCSRLHTQTEDISRNVFATWVRDKNIIINPDLDIVPEVWGQGDFVTHCFFGNDQSIHFIKNAGWFSGIVISTYVTKKNSLG